MRGIRSANLAPAALLIVLAGCGKSTSPTSAGNQATSPTASSTAGIAYDAANTMQGSDSLAHAPYGPAGLFGLPLGLPSGCPWDAGTQTFTCGPDALPNGLSETHSYQFRDASNAPQVAYDSLTTAAIAFDAHVSGTTTQGPWSVVDDTRSLVESGLAGSETSRTWNGTGVASREDSVRAQDGSRFVVTSSIHTTVNAVVVSVPFTRGSWPLSGSISTHLVASGGGRAVDQTSQLTFNGTEFATLTVGDSTFTVDLKRPPHGPAGGPCGGPPPGGPSGPGGPGGPRGPGAPGGPH